MKKLLTILLLIMLIISFFQIANTYALYKDGVDISSGSQNLTFTMTEDNLQYLESANVKENKMAPGTQACFEIIIDPTNTDVSILYTLDIKLSRVTEAKMTLVKVENYFQKQDETEQITNETVYTGEESHKAVIPIGKINEQYINHVKLYFEWTNVEERNEKDSEIGTTESAKISIPLEINLKQYTGEAISDETT